MANRIFKNPNSAENSFVHFSKIKIPVNQSHHHQTDYSKKLFDNL